MGTDHETGLRPSIRFGPSDFRTMPHHRVAAAARELEGALNAALERAENAEAERDRLAAAVQRVRAMQYQSHRTENDWVSGHDTGYNNCLGDVRRALDGRVPGGEATT